MKAKLNVDVSSGWARSSATWSIDVPARELPDLAERIVATLPQYALRAKGGDSILFARRMNWRTWGALIELRFAGSPAGSTIKARWMPRLKTTLIDWGQGSADIRQLHDALSRAALAGTEAD